MGEVLAVIEFNKKILNQRSLSSPVELHVYLDKINIKLKICTEVPHRINNHQKKSPIDLSPAKLFLNPFLAIPRDDPKGP